jgi:hypothetical protein
LESHSPLHRWCSHDCAVKMDTERRKNAIAWWGKSNDS